MANKAEFFVCVCTGGQFGLGHDEDAAKEDYENRIGTLSNTEGFRLVKIVLDVTALVAYPAELAGEVPPIGDATLESIE